MKKALALLGLLAVTLIGPHAGCALAEADDMVLISGGAFQMGSPEDEPWRSADGYRLPTGADALVRA